MSAGLPMNPEPSAPADLPPFAEAVAALSSFLRREGAPDDVIWIFREGVTSHRRKYWVRLSDASEATRHAKALYDAGRRKGLGVALVALCQVGSSTACYVWVPEDEVDASYAMQTRSLRCKVPVPLVTARRVTSALQWRLLRWVNRHRRYGDKFKSRVLPVRPPRGGVPLVGDRPRA